MENEIIPTLKVAEVFGTCPGGRLTEHFGKYSGEYFRENILVPFLQKHRDEPITIIDLDGVISYPPSFIDEGFGKAIKRGLQEQLRRVRLIGSSEDKRKLIRANIDSYVQEYDEWVAEMEYAQALSLGSKIVNEL